MTRAFEPPGLHPQLIQAVTTLGFTTPTPIQSAVIPGRTIGAIKIRAAQTVVDVPEQFVQQVLAKNGDYQVRKQLITIERAKQL